MDLKDFVDTTIRQIIDGVKAAQEYVANQDGAVNPAFTAGAAGAQEIMGFTAENVKVYKLAFDVAVTVHETKGEARVEVAELFRASSEAGFTEGSSSVSRMRFIVPIVFPEDTVTRGAKDAKEAKSAAEYRASRRVGRIRA